MFRMDVTCEFEVSPCSKVRNKAGVIQVVFFQCIRKSTTCLLAGIGESCCFSTFSFFTFLAGWTERHKGMKAATAAACCWQALVSAFLLFHSSHF